MKLTKCSAIVLQEIDHTNIRENVQLYRCQPAAQRGYGCSNKKIVRIVTAIGS